MFETAVPPSVRGPCRSAGRDPRWTLAVAILGSSMGFLDSTVVNVALPVMQRNLGASVAGVQWIVEAYALLLASLVLVGGALGDRLGRRRVFSAGVVLFALASAGCGLAPTLGTLVAARAIQGIGAALLIPGSLSLISAAYPEETRGAAIGTWSACSAVTSAVGPVAGGWVVAHASWRWLFFFNVPVAALVVALSILRVGETRDEEASSRLDVLGAVLVTAGLGLIVYALIDSGRAGGLGSPRTLALLLFGVLTLAAFVVVEARRAAPMVPLSLFRSRTFAGTNLLTLLLYAALGGALFFVPFDLIQVQRYSPAAAGAALLPLVVLISIMSPWAGSLSARIGPRPFLVCGPLLASVGFALLAVPSTGGDYVHTFFPGIVVLGLGMGATVAPLTAAVMGSVDRRHAGVASGINNAVSRTAGLLAIAGLGVLLLARFDRVLDGELAALPLPPALVGAVDAERNKLAGADFSAFAPPLRDALRRAFDLAYVEAFRALMLASAALAALGALAGLTMIEPRRADPDGRAH
ncbi:putative transmembrane efflux protein [Minicystis rosea]|nr:putative transmembrane efflux protein [Minicystis rosea]